MSPLFFKSNLGANFKVKFHWLAIIFILGYASQCQQYLMHNLEERRALTIPLLCSLAFPQAPRTWKDHRAAQFLCLHPAAQCSNITRLTQNTPTGSKLILQMPTPSLPRAVRISELTKSVLSRWAIWAELGLKSCYNFTPACCHTLTGNACSRMAKSNAMPEKEIPVFYTTA